MSQQASVARMGTAFAGMRFGHPEHSARSYVNDQGYARQVNTVQISVVSSTAYAFAINGYLIQYTSDSSATAAEVRDGLIDAARAIPELEAIASFNPSGNDIKITARAPGTGFTYSEPVSDTNLATTAVTANASTEVVGFGRALVKSTSGDRSARLPFAPTAQVATLTPTAANTTVYTIALEEDNGKLWAFAVTSDADATATEIVTLFKTAINNTDIPITASGTATLVLTADVVGEGFTVRETDSNIAVAATTANVGLRLVGVAERIHSGVDATAAAEGYQPFSEMTAIYQGEVWVEVEHAVAVDDIAYIRHTSGTGGTVVGKFRKDSDTNTAMKSTSMGSTVRFASATTGSGLARVKLNMA